jgi:hypothetical protein
VSRVPSQPNQQNKKNNACLYLKNNYIYNIYEYPLFLLTFKTIFFRLYLPSYFVVFFFEKTESLHAKFYLTFFFDLCKFSKRNIIYIIFYFIKNKTAFYSYILYIYLRKNIRSFFILLRLTILLNYKKKNLFFFYFDVSSTYVPSTCVWIILSSKLVFLFFFSNFW